MRLLISITVVLIAALLLVSGNTVVSSIHLQLHHHPLINKIAQYQMYALVVSLLTTTFFLWFSPRSSCLLHIGQLTTIAHKERWLGINGRSSWLKNGLQLLLSITLATTTFMYLGVQYSNSLYNFKWWFMPYVLLFSLVNSFSEEMIFRFGLIAGLEQQLSKRSLMMLSALLFGLPHYFGNPSGWIGVMMSGVLGYILCKASIESKGMLIAWTIHFVQDVIIFTAMMMMYGTTQ